MSRSQLEAEMRLLRALDRVQQAQRELDAAGQELSNLIGLSPEWHRVGKLYDQVKALWYRIEGKRQTGKFKLDGIAEQALAKKAAEPKDKDKCVCQGGQHTFECPEKKWWKFDPKDVVWEHLLRTGVAHAYREPDPKVTLCGMFRLDSDPWEPVRDTDRRCKTCTENVEELTRAST